MRVNVPVLAIAVLAGLAAGAGLRASYAANAPGRDEAWSTKKIMDRVALGKQSLLSVVTKDLQTAEPDWKSDEEKLSEIIHLMSMLTKQKPPRGNQEDWNTLVRDYVQGAKSARQNVAQRRLEPARAALEKARATCEECHDNHGIR
jgi:hypothetical protein